MKWIRVVAVILGLAIIGFVAFPHTALAVPGGMVLIALAVFFGSGAWIVAAVVLAWMAITR